MERVPRILEAAATQRFWTIRRLEIFEWTRKGFGQSEAKPWAGLAIWFTCSILFTSKVQDLGWGTTRLPE
eukprot:10852115-Prorocentrum_lima.AAC.1